MIGKTQELFDTCMQLADQQADQLREFELKNIASPLKIILIKPEYFSSKDIQEEIEEARTRVKELLEKPDYAGRHEVQRLTLK